MFDRVVVGLDGSEISERALAAGAELAKRMEAPLHLIRVADLAIVHWGSSEAAEAYAQLSSEMQEEQEEARQYLERVAKPLQEQGLAVTTEVRSGAAGRELAEAVSPNDLLVVASHGRGGLERLLIGSVAEDLSRHSPAPVLIVRAT